MGFLSQVPFLGIVTRFDGRYDIVNTSNGDITSLKFNGKELQDQSKFTQLSSGLGSATVTSSVANSIAVITIKTSTIVRDGLSLPPVELIII